MRQLYLCVSVLFIISFFTACPSDDDTANLIILGDECNTSCDGVAECVNGYCECPDTVRQLAYGFCIQSEDKPTFVTYDYYDLIIDTTVIEFDQEPFDKTWQNGDMEFPLITGRTYNRDPHVITWQPGIDIGYIRYPGHPSIPVDSIWLFNPLKPQHTGGVPDGNRLWTRTIFRGTFTDRNTIEGEVIVWNWGLWGSSDTIIIPPHLQEIAEGHYPVTFRRLE